MAAFWVSVLIRVGVGGVVVAAMARDGQVAGAVAAFGLGVAAPLVIEKLARLVPLNLDVQAALEPPPDLAAEPAPSGQGGQAGQAATGGGGNAP
ncbi:MULTISPECIES: hypothetical protein [Actinomadura]|uniref:Uncharacterized protein n=1 Tax=Actinomadura yumaensis TaxID=111807 RepID=A0ABW2CEG2_9ACTN|nr:hypothetical protein [Actinomadura sp. J1-007]MWK38398.1 hypothetical protein [Actinomadura sp. J1-007]